MLNQIKHKIFLKITYILLDNLEQECYSNIVADRDAGATQNIEN